MNKVAWFVFASLAIVIGVYPALYFIAGPEFGILSSKASDILANSVWQTGFYLHIVFGGLALLLGWSQFSKNLLKKKLELHRKLGKVYVISAMLSAVSGIYIGLYAAGGWVSSLGFMALGIFWILFTVMAYTAVRNRDIKLHKAMMVYSYAMCFAAVTLRIWLPLLLLIFGDFETSYRIVAWLCWLPNLLFAYIWVKRRGITLA